MALIEREEVLATMRNMVELPNKERVQAMAAVSRAKAVDAVEVVRCKDCKHYRHYGNEVYGCRTYGMMKTAHDGFCSYGERKVEDGKID